MNMQMLKIGTVVIFVAILGYIFILGNAKTGMTQAKSEQPAAVVT